jgi:hypothetical protein
VRVRVFPATLTPFEEFPSPAAVPRHRGRCPLAVSARFARRFAVALASAPSPLSWGSVRLPPQVNLARGTSRSAEAARSVDLPLPRRSGSGSVRPSPRPAEAGPGWATPSPLHAWARSGSGCRPPAPPERLGFALAAGFVRRFHPPWRPEPLGLLTPSRSLAEAGSLAGDCTQSRDVVGSVGASSPRLGLR